MRISLLLWVMLGLFTALPTPGQERNAGQDRRTERIPFRFAFSIQGVQFSDDQQAQIVELRQKYTPQLTELQRKLNSTYTAEQRRARQEAFRSARDAGKNGQEGRKAADAAAKLSDGQQKQLATLGKEQAKLVAKIQGEVRALLTEKQQAQVRRQANTQGRNRQARNTQTRPAIRPTHPDVQYGPHGRNVMDVWLAKSDKPTPVLVSIHGGGFRGGNKSVSGGILRACLESGISVVAITYRLTDEAIAPAQFHDSARAIQFIRHNAKKWNCDPTRLAATGGSAGAGISLWLGFHEDLADPDNDDPVLRQSTRLTCMAVYNGQTSYDPRFIRELFPNSTTYKESALSKLFDVDLNKLDDLPQRKYRLFEEVSALPHLTKDDAPVALFYASKLDTPITSQGIGIHHPRFGKALKEKMDELDIECHVHTGIPRGDEWTKLTVNFVKKHLRVE